jgi:hypothetical protein
MVVHLSPAGVRDHRRDAALRRAHGWDPALSCRDEQQQIPGRRAGVGLVPVAAACARLGG